MAPRIFITGVTGYIGGHQVAPLLKKHPDYHIVALVRTEHQAKILKEAFPTAETILGDLDSDEILQAEAGKADVVLNLASADHIPGAISLIKGIGASKSKATFIHISGTGVIAESSTGPGNVSDKIYHDSSFADVQDILSFDETHVHADVEAAIKQTAAEAGVTTAIISPPMIHGVGKGPVKKRSIQVPLMIENTLKRGKAFQVLEGQNIWNCIHIDDVASAITLLTEEALKGSGSKAVWLPKGYYFAETEEFHWSQVSAAIANIAHSKGLLKTDQVDKLSAEEAMVLHPWGAMIWGTNSRGKAELLKELGWKTSGKSWVDSIEAMIDFEAGAGEGDRQKLTFVK